MDKLKALVFIGTEGVWRDHRRNTPLLMELLTHAEGVETVLSEDASVIESRNMKPYDLCIFYTSDIGKLTNAQEEGLLDFVEGGKGFVGIHTATTSFIENQEYISMIGGKFHHHAPYQEFTVTIEDKEHPITKGITDFKIVDELYVIEHDPAKIHLLMTAEWEGKKQPMGYIKRWGRGKVFYIALGHDEAAFKNEVFRELVIRGVNWVA